MATANGCLDGESSGGGGSCQWNFTSRRRTPPSVNFMSRRRTLRAQRRRGGQEHRVRSSVRRENRAIFLFIRVFMFKLDGEHVVCGKVIDRMDTVYAIEGSVGTYNGKPRKKVIIADSGEIPKSKWDTDSRLSAAQQ